MEIYLSLGSNLGDRRAHILRAAGRLDDFFQKPHTALSPLRESEAWGFDGPPFLDAVIRYDIPDAGQDARLHAHALLAACKRIEAEEGRRSLPLFDAEGRRIYHDRPIDVDILIYGKERIREADLVIPHPLIGVRDFIRLPLEELASEEIRENFSHIFSGK